MWQITRWVLHKIIKVTRFHKHGRMFAVSAATYLAWNPDQRCALAHQKTAEASDANRLDHVDHFFSWTVIERTQQYNVLPCFAIDLPSVYRHPYQLFWKTRTISCCPLQESGWVIVIRTNMEMGDVALYRKMPGTYIIISNLQPSTKFWFGIYWILSFCGR